MCLCVRRSEQYVLLEDRRALGVKLCSLAPVTVSDRIIIKAAFEFLGLGIVKDQFVSLFKLYMPEKPLHMVCELIKYDKVSANYFLFSLSQYSIYS